MSVIQSLFQESNIKFEDGQAVWLALADYRNAKPVKGKEADFADALIINNSKQVANKENKPNLGVNFRHSFATLFDHFISVLINNLNFLVKLT